ncbi:MAG: sulfurtransferase [Magnetococcus sp. DMHC-8]
MTDTSSLVLDDPFPGLLVDTAWLADHLSHPGLRILQIGGESHYPRLHIPGAALLSLTDLVALRNGVPGMRADQALLAERFGRAGVTTGAPVLVYDVGSGMDAARAAWTLASLGHPSVAVLDGGLGIWYRENRPMTPEPPPARLDTFLPRPQPAWEATTAQVVEASRPGQPVLLLDTRTPQEYQGLTLREPRGHIAGARLFNWTDALRDPQDPRLKDPATLSMLFAQVGAVERQQEMIVYCETGHRAAHTWLLLRHLGFTRVRLYDGSMAEWRLLGYPVVAGSNPR